MIVKRRKSTYEAISESIMTEFQSALSKAIEVSGAVATINKLIELKSDDNSNYTDQLYYLKNTMDLGDTNEVLNAIYSTTQTLLEDGEIAGLVDELNALGAPEEEEEFEEPTPEDYEREFGDNPPEAEESIPEEEPSEENANESMGDRPIEEDDGLVVAWDDDYTERIKYLVADLEKKGPSVMGTFIKLLQNMGEVHGNEVIVADTSFAIKGSEITEVVDNGDPQDTLDAFEGNKAMFDFLKQNLNIEIAAYCEVCGQLYNIEEMEKVGDGYICEDCLEEEEEDEDW